MDRAIKRGFWHKKKVLTIAGVLALLILIIASYYATSGKTRLNTYIDRITISQAEMGVFQVTVPVNGIVLPKTSIYLDALEGGVVEEKYVEDGTMLTKGQPILKLSNTNLELNLSNQETEVFNVLTQMQIARSNAQENTTGKRNQMAEVDIALKDAKRIYKLDKALYEKKAIGSQESHRLQD
jgi:HlyD family secretion protein